MMTIAACGHPHCLGSIMVRATEDVEGQKEIVGSGTLLGLLFLVVADFFPSCELCLYQSQILTFLFLAHLGSMLPLIELCSLFSLPSMALITLVF